MRRIFMDLEMNTIGKDHKEVRQFCPQEVIEFGAVCLDDNLKETGEFQCYVKPEYNDGIAKHITNLTGIETAYVENAESFREVFARFLEWCGSDYEIYSWSESDPEQLRKEMALKNIRETTESRHLFQNWNDLQKTYDELIFCERQIGLKMAISHAGLEFKGRAHDALNDARATADLYREMEADGSLRKLRNTLEEAKKPLSQNLGDLFAGIFAFA